MKLEHFEDFSTDNYMAVKRILEVQPLTKKKRTEKAS